MTPSMPTWRTACFPLPTGPGWSAQAVGLGENSVDRLVRVNRLPPSGGKAEILREDVLPGGQVATALVACRTLGLGTVRYFGKVGDDDGGRLTLSSLQTAGVDCRGVRVEPGVPTRTAWIVIEGDTGERTVFWHRDSRLRLRPGEIDAEAICSAPVLLVDGHDPEAAVWAARQARTRGILVVLDIDTPTPRCAELLAETDFCIGPASFFRQFTGETNLDRALAVAARFCSGLPVATLGPDGASVWWDGGLATSPGFVVSAVDTTGAGDAFHGAFLYGLSQGWALGHLLDFANAAAALNCTALGARGGLSHADTVARFGATAKRRPHPQPG